MDLKCCSLQFLREFLEQIVELTHFVLTTIKRSTGTSWSLKHLRTENFILWKRKVGIIIDRNKPPLSDLFLRMLYRHSNALIY